MIPIPYIDPKAAFESIVPDDVQLQMYRRVLAAYEDTRDDMVNGGYGDLTIRDMFPQVLKGKIDTNFASLPLEHLGGNARITINRANTASHSLISLPGVLITVSAVASPKTLVRRAEFRNAYAQLQSAFEYDPSTNSLRLPEGIPVSDSTIYGIVIHGPTGNRQFNGFTDIVFVGSNGKYLESRINLRDKFEQVDSLSDGTESVPDQVVVTPKSVPETSTYQSGSDFSRS